MDRYHAVIYAVGAQTDKHMGIPGEDLPGSWAATELVAWYNGHPDYRGLEFDLSCKTARSMIGNGNVAMDVTRMLAAPVDELAKTDVADTLEVLRESRIEEVVVLGAAVPRRRRSPTRSCSRSRSRRRPTCRRRRDLELDEHSRLSIEGEAS